MQRTATPLTSVRFRSQPPDNMNFKELKKIYIISEIGVNHNGDLNLAKKMIDKSFLCGADAVKFQTYKTELLADQTTPKVKYQLTDAHPEESHFDMLKKYELNDFMHDELINYSRKVGIDFISTPYDPDSVIYLDKIGMGVFKTASADIIDHAIHNAIEKTKKPVIISTGMSEMSEIEETLKIYPKGHEINLMHCVSNYPCQIESLNLNCLKTFKSKFNHSVGYSDHSVGNTGAILSVSLGAKVIERHFTLDKTLDGPDHKASMDTKEFTQYVKHIRAAEQALGDGNKRVFDEELEMRKVSRKSLHANLDLNPGDVVSAEHLISRRPGTGITPNFANKIIGRRVAKPIRKGAMINNEVLDE